MGTFVTEDILMQETVCPVCVETRAISFQVGLGAILPAASAFYGSVVVGMFNKSAWVPRNFTGVLNLTKNTISNNSKLLMGMTVLQLLLAGGLVHLQVNCFEDVMAELNRRYEVDHPKDQEKF